MLTQFNFHYNVPFQQLLKWYIIMKINNIIESAKDALLSELSKVPFLKILDVQQEFSEKSTTPDLNIKIELPNDILELKAEVKSSGQPRLAREAVNQLLRYKDKTSQVYLVFIAPYISSKAADICQAENIGYLDLSGNCLLSFDKIYIERNEYPNQFKENRDLKSLYTPKAERILRTLLCNPGKKWKIKELSFESGVSLGQASNVKKLLFDSEYLTGKQGGFSLENPYELLNEWAKNYDYRKNGIQELYSLMNPVDIENTVAAFCMDKNIKYALTGFSAAARVAPTVRYNKAMIYAENLTGLNFSELSLKTVKSGGNLLLFTPYDEGVFYGSSMNNGIQSVSDIQTYLDLIGFRGRGEEAAEAVYERIAKKAW